MIRARLIDGTIRAYRDLAVGDLFQAVAKDQPVHPLTLEPAREVYARVAEPPRPAPPIGWAVLIEVGKLDELRRKAH